MPPPTQSNENEQSYIIHTDRLILRMADPRSEEDCEQILRIFFDTEAGKGGISRTGVSSIDDVRYKHELHGPIAKLCTLTPPPGGLFLLIFQRQDEDVEGDYVGIISLCFRREMPYPDLGWSVFAPFQGQGYATEAGKAGLKFWTETIGVKEICAMTLDGNERSVRLAERIGFVKAGTVDIWFDEDYVLGRGLVLPGMEWRDGLWIRPVVRRPEGWRWEG